MSISKTVKYSFEKDKDIIEITLTNNPTSPSFQEQQKDHLLKIKGKDNQNLPMCRLFDPKAHYYLNNLTQISSDIVYQMKNCSLAAKEMVSNLEESIKLFSLNSTVTSSSPSGASLLRIMNELTYNCEVVLFAEEFIQLSGITNLLKIIEVATTSNARVKAIEAFANLLDYKNALQYVEENIEVFKTFARLLITENAAKNVNGVSKILAVLILIINDMKKEGSDILYQVAQDYSKLNGTKVFAEIVHLIDDKYHDIKVNSMLLIILVLTTMTDKDKQAAILCDLQEAGIDKVLQKNSEYKATEFQSGLTCYQQMTGEIIKGSYYEIETCKKKMVKYEEHCSGIEKRVEFVFQNQKFYDEIVEDFIYFKRLSETCATTAGYFEPYIPYERYDYRLNKKVSADHNGVVDLKKLADNANRADQMKSLEQYIDVLKDKISKLEQDNQMLIDRFKNFDEQRENEGVYERNEDYDDLIEMNRILMKNVDDLRTILRGEVITNETKVISDKDKERQKMIMKKLSDIGNIGEGIEGDNNGGKVAGGGNSFKNLSRSINVFYYDSANPKENPGQKDFIEKKAEQGNNSIGTVPSISNVPSVPGIPSLPGAGIPLPPPLPGIPGVPGVPGIPGVPGLPNVPLMPQIPVLQPTKKAIKLPLKCKAINWKRIINDPEKPKSLWSSLQEQKLPMDLVINLFASKSSIEKPKDPSSSSQSKSSKPSNEKITFLDSKRNHSVSISLAKFPPISLVSKALSEMDDSLVSTSNLEALIREYIRPEEITEYQKYKDPSTNWAKAEDYLIKLYNIPHSKEKLTVWLYMTNFEDDLDNTVNTIDFIIDACDELRQNKYLTLIFSYILTIGNICNGGTDKGQADGFDLGILAKLYGVKDKDNKSVLHFICAKVKEIHSEFEDLGKQFPNVINAHSNPYNETVKNWNILKRGFDEVEKNAELIKTHDVFKKKTSSFMKKAKEQIPSTQKKLDNALKKFQDTATYFGLNNKDVLYKTPEEFFKLFIKFFEDIEKSMPPKDSGRVFCRKHEVGQRIDQQETIALIRSDIEKKAVPIRR